MSSSNKDRYYTGNVAKSRRSSPGDSQGSVFFQGQGGRTVLPPISSAFPTSRFPVPSTYSSQYTQPRSSPGRYELSSQAFYGQWPSGNSPQLTPSFANYETHDRYSTPQSYTTYPSRSSPPILSNPTDSRRLPPLATSSAMGNERWQQPSYTTVPSVPGYPGGTIRSPTASYPSAYVPYSSGQGHDYSYHLSGQGHMPLNPQGHHNLFDEMDAPRNDPRASSPFGRSGNPSQMVPQSYTPPPISPTSTEEPTIKKKRKRADAAQLKVLNETYARTAFPSTEERAALAKQLDMTPRSVQIWFQNKRQSMRQTNRQSSTAGASHQSFAVSVQDGGLDDLHSGYGGTITMTEPFLSGPSPDVPRSHTSHSHSQHSHSHHSGSHHSTHGHSGDSVDPRKWSRGGY